MTSQEEILVTLPRLNDPVYEKDKPGILLGSLQEEFSFLADMVHSQNMDYESICAILKDEAERRKRFKDVPEISAPNSALTRAPMGAARLADTPPPTAPGHSNAVPSRQKDMECWYCGELGH